ncbi:hypothetical protein [Streptomyces shenzhenensis]|uniref:hypothetical protein n=1 Tax=Streptomyces shenzhenensis TaxID=943815 RepID=UPI0015F03C04
MSDTVLRRGPDHLAHRLRRLGLTSQGATVVLGAASFAGVLPAVLVHTGWTGPAAVTWAVGVTLAVVLGLLGVPVYGPRRATGAHTIGRQTRAPGTRVPGTRTAVGADSRPEYRMAP